MDLAEFQKAAVARICQRLTARGGSRRFLLADEVGLGKTAVARGVIDELQRRRGGRGLVVVYLCSNSEIAEQNRTRLAPGAPQLMRRITHLIQRSITDQPLKLYSFTPGTSLGGGTGLMWERQLLLFLVHRVLRHDIRKGNWREYFRCGVRDETWKPVVRFRALQSNFNRKISRDLQRRIAEEWAPLSDELRRGVEEFDVSDADSRRGRNRFIGKLRTAVQRVLLDDLRPDLVILDEVQRFRQVIQEADDENSIASRLFMRRPGVLILSATPYRMFALDHEGHAHYDEFLATVRFLFDDHGKQEAEQVRRDLLAFGDRLGTGKFLREEDRELLKLRERIEDRLGKVICRTERSAYIHDRLKGVREIRSTENAMLLPGQPELLDYVQLRRFLLDKIDCSQRVTDYWKSCPSPFTFMDTQYMSLALVRRRRASVPAGIVERPGRVFTLAERNLKFRELFKTVFGSADSNWKFLWTKPSHTYYRDEFFRDADPRKMLVFSGWRFVPKAIALLTSLEAERRIAPRSLASDSDRPPLRFTEKRSFHVFDVCMPSPALARLIEPSALAHETLTAAELLKRTRHALKTRLAEAGIEIAATRRSRIWEVVARLERVSGSGIQQALKNSKGYRGGETTKRFADHVDEFVGWMQEDAPLRISREQFLHLAHVSAFSPAISLLRAMWVSYPGSDATSHELSKELVDVCFSDLRSYFNRRIVREIVSRSTNARRGYARNVIDYCGRAHFQAVVDEYLYLGKNVLQRNCPAEMAKHLGRVLSVGAGSPGINQTSKSGRIKAKQAVFRSHFAVAFGEDVRPDPGAPEQPGPGRKTAIREAFNSPFWPFVLSTTSVGQEGLDFHLFCRDVVHWNLPSNPVDLEQREGRVNRRDGLAVRRAIARKWPLARLGQPRRGESRNSWERIFAAIDRELESECASDRKRDTRHGLYPHWIFEPAEGGVEPIHRHLFFYSDSRDTSRYAELKERLALYRLVFGQPRQQDLLERIQRSVRNGAAGVTQAALTQYMINLSPLGKEQARDRKRLDDEERVEALCPVG